MQQGTRPNRFLAGTVAGRQVACSYPTFDSRRPHLSLPSYGALEHSLETIIMKPTLWTLLTICLAILPCLQSPTANADEKLKGIACRSVHFGYPGPDAQLFYNQITVQKSAPGTYFCVIGWNKGYFGIQQLANDKRVAIFSVWDSGDNDPNALANEKRTQVLYVDPEVTVKRFGGEGSGGQSFLPFEWKEGQSYHFAVVSRDLGSRTAYSGWLKDPSTDQWRHLITFSTITGGKPMNGFYSFVEDFKRDRKSTTFTRSATFSGMFRLQADGTVLPQSGARFTGDSNPVVNIDAVKSDSGIQLNTGGDITNEHLPLGQSFPWEASAPADTDWAKELIESSRKDSQTPAERKHNSQSTMQPKDIPFLNDLPNLPSLNGTVRREVSEVWKRFQIETALGAKADGEDSPELTTLIQQLDSTLLQPQEQSFLQAEKPDINDEIRFLWHTERASVLAWSLGLLDELPWANQTTQPRRLLELLSQEKSPTQLIPQSRILDQADLTYRMHWSVLNAKYMDRDAPDHLQVDVLAERHYALAWLLGLPSLEKPRTEEPLAWSEVKPSVQRIRQFASPVK